MTQVEVHYVCEVCGVACATIQKAATKFLPRFCSEHRQDAARKRFNAFTDKTRERGRNKTSGS